MRGNRPILRSNTGGFHAAAMLNSFRDVNGEDVANVVSELIGDGLDISFASSVDAFQRCGGKLEIQKVNVDNVDDMEWLVARCMGVYLAKLNQHQVLYRCVF